MAVAGSATIAVSDQQSRARPIRKYTLAWTSSAGGAVTEVPAVSANQVISGEIVRVVFVNDPVDTPTDLYDVTLLDSDGADILNGQGANIPIATATVQKVPNFTPAPVATTRAPIYVDSKCQLAIAAAGNAKKGKVIIYTIPPALNR